MGRVPTDADSLFFLPASPWAEARPAELHAPAGADSNVLAERYLPWRIFARDALAKGESLLWNPYEDCGMPFMALWQTRCFSPFSVPFYVFPLKEALPISAALKLLVAGLCAFLMGRLFGLPLPMALFTGLAFQFSGLLLSHIGIPLSDVLPWLPLLILFADRFSLGLYAHWPYGALALALMLFGGEPGAAAAAFAWCMLFILVRKVLARAPLADIATAFVAFLAVGTAAAGLAAVQILPFIEFAGEAASTGYGVAGLAPQVQDVILLLFPWFLGAISAAGMGGSSPLPTMLYIGAAPALLLPIWFALRSYPAAIRRTRVEALLLTAVFMLAMAILSGGLLRQTPLLHHIQPVHWLIGFGLALIYTAAESADEWVELDADGCRHVIKRLLFIFPIFLLLLGLAIAAHLGDSRPSAAPFQRQIILPALMGLIMLALLSATLLRPSTHVMGYSLCFLCAVDLLFVFHPAMPFTEPAHIFPETQFIASLKATQARISGMESLQRWPLLGNLVPQVYGTSGVELARHRQFVGRLAETPLLLRRMGSRHLLLTKEDIQGSFASVRPMLAVQHVYNAGAILFEDLGANSRVWMAYDTRNVEQFNPADLDPEAAPLVETVTPWSGAADPGPATAMITEEHHTRITVHAEAPREGVLVLADSWYPGWRATVDGVETEVFPVEGILRGVLVKEGSHEIVFRYRPNSFLLGLALTATTAITASILVLFSTIRAYKKRRSSAI